MQSSKSRFLPTLTEVVHAGHIAPIQRVPEVPESAPAVENPHSQVLTADLEEALRGQLQALLNAQIQLALPQLQSAIDIVVKQAVSNAIAQYQLSQR